MKMNKYWSTQEILYAGKRKSPSKRLLTYLEDFKTDKLTTNSPERLDSFNTQREVLVNAMKSLYPVHGVHQTIEDISLAIPNFWELLFTLHYLTHEIELTDNIGYTRKQIGAGIYVANEHPYAELTIMSIDLIKSLKFDNNDTSEKRHINLSLDRRNRKLTIRIDGHRYLLKQYRSEKSNIYMALLKLYTNAGEPQTRSDLMSSSSKTELKHLPKNIGFVGIIREQFIENGFIDKQRTLTLHKTRELNIKDYEQLRAEFVKS